jgi:hypothetical protein
MRCFWLLLVFAVTACAPQTAGLGSGPRRCVDSDDCPDGQRCRDGVCEARPLVDAGTPSQDDAGTVVGDEDGGAPPTPRPSGEELCGNGRDDDGDGEPDEQCACEVGLTQACSGADPALAGVGACALGSQACEASGEFGSWGPCLAWVGPSEETCDGIDNDCDGAADEGCECVTGTTRACYTGPTGTEGVGLCAPGTQVCVAGGWGPCEGVRLPGVDRCDGVDNDCDGVPDEGCTCAPGTPRGCFETPSGASGEGTPGVGACRAGTATCVELPGGGSDYGSCVGAVTASAEICRNGTDEDCDGLVDEGCSTPTVDCTIADVLFLMDTTGSMGGEIAQIQARLRDTIIPGLAAEIADVRFAVARFDDFPVGSYGSSGDLPFQLVQPITSDVLATQSAVNSLSARGGGDGPESQVEALYQSATGAGISPWTPSASCPSGGGYPCFRPGATPIVLLFTDAEFHNGPGGRAAYGGISPTPHTYAQAVSALNAIGAKVLGLMSGTPALSDLTQIARDTGALAADGTPIVFDIGSDGARLGVEVVRAIQTLCR